MYMYIGSIQIVYVNIRIRVVHSEKDCYLLAGLSKADTCPCVSNRTFVISEKGERLLHN